MPRFALRLCFARFPAGVRVPAARARNLRTGRGMRSALRFAGPCLKVGRIPQHSESLQAEAGGKGIP